MSQATLPIHEVIDQVIKERIKKESEILVKEAKEKLELRVPEIIAGVAVDVMGYVQMETLNKQIVITIKNHDQGTHNN